MTQKVAFSRPDGNLVDLQITANADSFAAGTAVASVSGTDGGGIAYWRDVSTMQKYGVFDDQVLGVTIPTASSQSRTASAAMALKVAINALGSKTAVVLRDPVTADVCRELDKVTIHDPEMGLNYQSARVIGYTFDEGQATQTLTLDAFSIDDPNIPSRRFHHGMFQAMLKFGNR